MPTSSTKLNRIVLNFEVINTFIYLGIQLDGVLSTSQAAKSFMGTGFDALVIFSDLFFSVIFDQQHRTTKHKVFSLHNTIVGSDLHCYSSTNHSTGFYFIVEYEYEAEFDANNNTQYIFIKQSTKESAREQTTTC